MTPKLIFDQQDRLLSRLSELENRIKYVSQALVGTTPPNRSEATTPGYPEGILPRISTVNEEIIGVANSAADHLRFIEEGLGLVETAEPPKPASERNSISGYRTPAKIMSKSTDLDKTDMDSALKSLEDSIQPERT